jgi:hypothetical protein
MGVGTAALRYLHSWDEWTGGSYIEPDTVHRMKYLDAIRDMFGLPEDYKTFRDRKDGRIKVVLRP